MWRGWLLSLVLGGTPLRRGNQDCAAIVRRGVPYAGSDGGDLSDRFHEEFAPAVSPRINRALSRVALRTRQPGSALFACSSRRWSRSSAMARIPLTAPSRRGWAGRCLLATTGRCRALVHLLVHIRPAADSTEAGTFYRACLACEFVTIDPLSLVANSHYARSTPRRRDPNATAATVARLNLSESWCELVLAPWSHTLYGRLTRPKWLRPIFGTAS